MNAMLRSMLFGAGLCAALCAQASLTVTPGLTVINVCGQEIAIAVRYKATSGWTTTSFVNVRAGGSRDRVASTNNSIIYFYAQSLSGKHKWAGDVNHKVDGQVYGMKKKQLELDSERNRYVLSLSCSGN